eukprot:COSAG04_NODE_844_length_9919_cov_8.434216_10_plen_163_part_01
MIPAARLRWSLSPLLRRPLSTSAAAPTAPTAGTPTPTPIRDEYPFWRPIQLRWDDHDTFGHLNNVQFYSLMDTTIAHFILHRSQNAMRLGAGDGGLPATVPFVVQSSCSFRAPLCFPTVAHVGIRVAELGTSSVTYDTAIFDGGRIEAEGVEAVAAAAVGSYT